MNILLNTTWYKMILLRFSNYNKWFNLNSKTPIHTSKTRITDKFKTLLTHLTPYRPLEVKYLENTMKIQTNLTCCKLKSQSLISRQKISWFHQYRQIWQTNIRMWWKISMISQSQKSKPWLVTRLIQKCIRVMQNTKIAKAPSHKCLSNLRPS